MSEELPEYKICPVIGDIGRSVWFKHEDTYYVARTGFLKLFFKDDYLNPLSYIKNHEIADHTNDIEINSTYKELMDIIIDVYKLQRFSVKYSFFTVQDALNVIKFVEDNVYKCCIDVNNLAQLRQFINKLNAKEPEQQRVDQFHMKDLFNHRVRTQKRLEYVRTDRFKRFTDQIFNEYMEDGRKRNREYLESQDIDDKDLKDEVRNDPRVRRIAVSMVASHIRVSFDHIYKVQLPFKKQKQ